MKEYNYSPKKGEHNNVFRPRNNKNIKNISSKSKNPLLKKIALAALGVSIIFMIWAMVHIFKIGVFPISYILIFLLLFGACVFLQSLLISKKTRKITLKVLSITLSFVLSFTSLFLIGIVGNLDTFIDNLGNTESENNVAVKNITNTPFIVYLSGMDTRDLSSIHSKGLSDVNMIIACNPSTKKILMVSTPRDYYVDLWGEANKTDKLTHAGTKGIECSMQTLEALYDISFNYYVKVNFKSVVDIVDALGGITVESDYNFNSAYSLSNTRYTFVKGTNELTGDSALAFARERSSFANGDRQRGIHQQKIISAIINKAISPSMLNSSKLQKFLKAVTDNVITSFSSSEISAFVKMQLKDMSSWNIESYSVDGRGAARTTYLYPNQKLSVIIPDYETVETAKTKINSVINTDSALSSSQTETSAN